MVRRHMQNMPCLSHNYEKVHRMLATQASQGQREEQGLLTHRQQVQWWALSLVKGQACLLQALMEALKVRLAPTTTVDHLSNT